MTATALPVSDNPLRTARARWDREPGDRALERAEASYRSLIQGALHGIFRSSVDGKFLVVNPALVQLLGYESADELLAVDLARNIYVDPTERARLIEQVRTTERIQGLEVDWLRKDGSRITVRLSGRPVLDSNGELRCLEMIVEDVTEHRRLEAQLRQAQKMEAVGQLTGGIAHDFNNILTVILAEVDFVANSLLPSQADLRTDLEQVQATARRGAALVKKLLSFSRRDSLAMKPLDLVGLVADLSGMVRHIVPEDIEIQLQSDQSVGMVLADPGAVEQMLLNLVTNARDSMPDGGILRLECGRTWLDSGYHATHPWVDPGEYVTVAVSDTGVGMDEATKERIFEPFFTTKRPGHGTGLGMAMIYGLAKQHRGFVHVYSEPGHGTRVKIHFPIAGAGDEPYAPTQTPNEVRGGVETILVVEDEPAIRRATRRVLESGGYTVLLAADGEEALELLRTSEREVDLVISDLVMPRLGGRQLYEAMKQEHRKLSVLFTSGYSWPDLQESAVLEPDMPFLHKPWTVAELLGRVREVLDKDREVFKCSARLRHN
ncbi:MAG: ATP-binding protein [Gemmatimonadales bacterium]